MAVSSILAEPFLKETGLQTEDLRLLLEVHGWVPVADGPYFRCGQGWDIAGWRLHISVTKSHFRQVVEDIVPLLSRMQVSINLFRDYSSAETLVNGGYGIELQGKALSVLPDHDQQACEIAGL